jgi:hypothetical protein
MLPGYHSDSLKALCLLLPGRLFPALQFDGTAENANHSYLLIIKELPHSTPMPGKASLIFIGKYF